MHSALCTLQCRFWHSGPQYHALLHPPHRMALSLAVRQCAQSRAIFPGFHSIPPENKKTGNAQKFQTSIDLGWGGSAFVLSAPGMVDRIRQLDKIYNQVQAFVQQKTQKLDEDFKQRQEWLAAALRETETGL